MKNNSVQSNLNFVSNDTLKTKIGQVTTLKITSKDETTLAKIKAVLTKQFSPFDSSGILCNKLTGDYYCFLNISTESLKEQLQEISAFPEGA